MEVELGHVVHGADERRHDDLDEQPVHVEVEEHLLVVADGEALAVERIVILRIGAKRDERDEGVGGAAEDVLHQRAPKVRRASLCEVIAAPL